MRFLHSEGTPSACYYTLIKGWLLLSQPTAFLVPSSLHAQPLWCCYSSSRTKYVSSVGWGTQVFVLYRTTLQVNWRSLEPAFMR